MELPVLVVVGLGSISCRFLYVDTERREHTGVVLPCTLEDQGYLGSSFPIDIERFWMHLF